MKESSVWKYLESHLPTGIAAERFEVFHPPGGSDVLWTDSRTSISGWLELKYCELNDKELLLGRIPKLKPEQPMFLRRQAQKGMPSGILMRVGKNSWYFWRSTPHHIWVERVRSNEALMYANRIWEDAVLPVTELFAALGCPL